MEPIWDLIARATSTGCCCDECRQVRPRVREFVGDLERVAKANGSGILDFAAKYGLTKPGDPRNAVEIDTMNG